MKLVRTCVLFLLIAGFGFAAEPVIEFRGVMVGGGPTKLSLVDKSSDTTRWIEVGQTFMGYTIKAYDTATETATLTRAGKEYRIRLNSAKIIEAAAQPASAAPAAATKTPEEIKKSVLNNLRQISAAADQYRLEYGVNVVPLAELVGPTKYIKRLVPVDGESYAGLSSMDPGKPISVTTQTGVSVSYAP